MARAHARTHHRVAAGYVGNKDKQDFLQTQASRVTSPAVNHILRGWGYITMQVCTFVDVPFLSLPSKPPPALSQ